MATQLHLRSESGDLVGVFTLSGTVLVEHDKQSFTIYGVEAEAQADGWSRAKYVWADYRSGRAIYVRISSEDKGPRWYRAGTGRSLSRSDMTGLNPTPVEKETE